MKIVFGQNAEISESEASLIVLIIYTPPEPENENHGAQPGIRANDHSCHGLCSEPHEPRQRTECLIYNVGQKMKIRTKTILAGIASSVALVVFSFGILEMGSDSIELVIQGSGSPPKPQWRPIISFESPFLFGDFVRPLCCRNFAFAISR